MTKPNTKMVRERLRAHSQRRNVKNEATLEPKFPVLSNTLDLSPSPSPTPAIKVTTKVSCTAILQHSVSTASTV